MKKFHRLIIILLYFYKCVSLESAITLITEVKKTIYLPCGVNLRGDIGWFKDGALVLQYKKGQKYQSTTFKGVNRFSVPKLSTGDMEVKSLELSDLGSYTCQQEKKILHSVKLIVFEVSATPSTKLISSEDLTLSVHLPPGGMPGLQVYWKKDDRRIEDGMSVAIKNVGLDRSGYYWCHIKMEGAEEVKTSTEIKVFGFNSAPSDFVYLKDPKSVILPWNLNLELQPKYISNEAKVVGVNITYPSLVTREFTSTEEACWPKDCVTKGNILLSNPKIGDYQIEILLEVEGRRKSLWRNVCLADLAVSSSDDDLSMDSSITLQCQTNCRDKKGKLCWHNLNLNYEKCGPPGQINLTEDVTVLAETLGNWTCRLVVGEEIMVSANLTLEVQAGFVDLSSYLFWVAIGVGVLILLLIVIIIVIVVARSRRLRRARKRAWLLQNIHQKRKCECEGFPPRRLKENV